MSHQFGGSTVKLREKEGDGESTVKRPHILFNMKKNSNTSLSCPFCKEFYIDARSLSCGHSICMKCAEFQICNASFRSTNSLIFRKSVLKGEQTFELLCLECGEVTSIKKKEGNLQDELPPNKEVMEKIKQKEKEKGMCFNVNCNNKAVCGCLVCMKLCCEKHQKMHQEFHEDHETVSVENFHKEKHSGKKICKKHEQPCNYYCFDDKEMVCVTCTQGTHKEHKWTLWEEFEEELKFVLLKKIKGLVSSKETCEELLEKVKNYLNMRETIFRERIVEIEEFEKKAVHIIQQKCKEMLGKNKESHLFESKLMRMQIENLEVIVRELKALGDLDIRGMGNHHLCSESKKIENYCSQLSHFPHCINVSNDDIVLCDIDKLHEIINKKLFIEQKFHKIETKPKHLEFIYQSDFDKNGILYWIGCNFGKEDYKNPVERNLINVTTSTSCCIHGQPQDLISHEPVNCMLPECSNSYVTIEFLGNLEICPSKYSIRHINVNKKFLRNWKLLASKDGKEWKELRNHVNDKTLDCVPYATGSWDLPSSEEYFRFFVIKQTGNNSSGVVQLSMGGFELFGYVIQRDQQ